MREIKFRGKRVDNGEWVYGDYQNPIDYGGEYWWINDRFMEIYNVIPETVGQYTGLKDKNGVKIFEGDIVNNGYIATYTNGKTNEFFTNGVVEYDYKNTCYIIRNIDGVVKRITTKTIKERHIKVIGNIHDNPELLEVE